MGAGIRLFWSSNYNSISGNNITANDGFGIWLSSSFNNSIFKNNITNNNYGIYLSGASSNSVFGNKIGNNTNGILLHDSSNNTISGNCMTANNYISIEFRNSTNNSVYRNKITNNNYGIWLFQSSNHNRISENNITASNRYGVALYDSSNNRLYHNDLIDNSKQVHFFSYNSVNVWDDGYPSGGNYWSDYTGVDVKSGANQDQPSSDGIGDTACVIDENNQDNYPLMSPWGLDEVPEEEIPLWMQWWFWTIVVAGIVALAGTIYFSKKRKPTTQTTSTLPTECTLLKTSITLNSYLPSFLL